MGVFPEYSPSFLPTAPGPGAFSASVKHDRHDERASQSGSDDGSSYLAYSDAVKNETDPEDDANASLTSQTLNADGTPKRPMNAFMIFARRRRPQVSAENQSMRTGEISKILSKEWSTMQPSDKQFYLDQAKQLKDTFNSKYPDYVYRRRPNNSRKRRKTDASSRSLDNCVPSDPGDDPGGVGDLAESSPDGEDSQVDIATEPHYRSSHEVSQSFTDRGHYPPSHTRSSSYSYFPPDYPYRTHENRLTYPSTVSARLSHDVGSAASPRVSQPSQVPQPYTYPLHPLPQTSQYTTDGDSHTNWDSRANHGRSGWVTNNDRCIGTTTASKYSPTPPASSWPSASPPVPTHAPGDATSHFPFPTLSTPFYPGQTQQLSSTASSIGSPPQQYNSPGAQMASPIPGRLYGDARYSTSPSMSPANSYPSPPITRGSSSLYQQQSSSRPSTGSPLNLPPVQAINSYSHPQQQHMHPGPPGSIPPTTHSGYWSRDKIDGH